MTPLSKALPTVELLHIRNINGIHTRAIIRQQRRQRTPNDLAPINHSDGPPMKPIPIRQYGIVYPQILEDLNNSERGARQDALLRVLGVEEPYVLVHVEDVAVGKALDVLGERDKLLDVLVLPRVEDRVVDYYAVDGGIRVGGEDGIFELFAIDGAELELEAAFVRKY